MYIKKADEPMVSRRTLPMYLKVYPARCAFGNAAYLKEAQDTADFGKWKTAGSVEEGLMKETCLTITIRFPPTVWVILSVPGVPDLDILDMRFQTDRNTAT